MAAARYDYETLLKNIPPGGIRQRVQVTREEEQVATPNIADPSDVNSSTSSSSDILESVNVNFADGKLLATVVVRCWRIVPTTARGMDKITYKKSSVIVTKLIEIDLPQDTS